MKWLGIITVMTLALPGAIPWEANQSKPSPRVYGDDIPMSSIRPGFASVQRKIVEVHNYYRSKVNPAASNMLMMRWSPGLAKSAQKWANRCLGLFHDNTTDLHLDNYGRAGQNIFFTTARTLWNFPIRVWYAEYKDFTYGINATNELLKVGHYTQMVWATTHLVGCGLSHCTSNQGPIGLDHYLYVCNYAPSGNYESQLGIPYEKGEWCSKCKGNCSNGKLCTNWCEYADLWSNCAELVSTFREWLCDTETEEGRERREFCAATCSCSGKIY
ncbi:cysteine-rich secretory protein 3-like [Prorops nasuta]|uniref:cysteine-rich secretory protein 3-like n=1 Tax=Prorops nasuta TaxID=863751 RepID=UPI0034CD24E8